jgi:hypothetical protein
MLPRSAVLGGLFGLALTGISDRANKHYNARYPNGVKIDTIETYTSNGQFPESYFELTKTKPHISYSIKEENLLSYVVKNFNAYFNEYLNWVEIFFPESIYVSPYFVLPLLIFFLSIIIYRGILVSLKKKSKSKVVLGLIELGLISQKLNILLLSFMIFILFSYDFITFLFFT